MVGGFNIFHRPRIRYIRKRLVLTWIFIFLFIIFSLFDMLFFSYLSIFYLEWYPSIVNKWWALWRVVWTTCCSQKGSQWLCGIINFTGQSPLSIITGPFIYYKMFISSYMIRSFRSPWSVKLMKKNSNKNDKIWTLLCNHWMFDLYTNHGYVIQGL